jgi:polyisoprenoid-binding protein YceI
MNTLRSAFPAALLLFLATGITGTAETYTIDPAHSSAFFRVIHLKVSPVYGLFENVTGSVVLNDKDPSASQVNLQIEASGIETGNGKRDEHLEGPDFFNAREFPVLRFASTKIRKSGAAKYEVTGLLTIRGVSKEITATFTVTGSAKGPKGELRKGGETVFSVKRSDFGINFMPDAIGDEVEVRLAVQGILDQAAPAP